MRLAKGTVRIALGSENTVEDVERIVDDVRGLMG